MTPEGEGYFTAEHESSDPRRELLETGPVERSDTFDYREFEKSICAQTFGIEIKPDGSIIGIPNGLYIPEDERRLEWEDTRSIELNSPRLFEQHLEAQSVLKKVLEGNPVNVENPVRVDGRIAFGTSYIYKDSTTGEELMAMRFNNDPNNPYRDWANPCSGMVRTLPSKFHPGEQLRKSYSEIIPLNIDHDGEIQPYIPSSFGGKTGGRSREDYKRKAIAVMGQAFGADLKATLNNFRQEHELTNYGNAPKFIEGVVKDFSTVHTDTGVDLELHIPNSKSPAKQRNLLATITPFGALECQRIVVIPAPDTLVDPEYGSVIAVISVQELTDYLEHIYNDPQALAFYSSGQRIPTPPPVKFNRLIDGATGKPTVQAPELGLDAENGSLKDFQISPPLRVLIEYLHRQREKSS